MLVDAFNGEKALVGAFPVIVKLRVDLRLKPKILNVFGLKL